MGARLKNTMADRIDPVMKMTFTVLKETMVEMTSV
jgi:hypothetical protein